MAGRRKKNDDTKFVWKTGNDTAVEYTNFDVDDHQPDNGGGIEDCLTISETRRYRWNDLACQTSGLKICSLCELNYTFP